MSNYLKKPSLRKTTKIVQGAPFPEDHVREKHVTPPLASNAEVPEKTDELRNVEIPDDKVIAAKEKKKEQTAKTGPKKPPLKRPGAGNVSSRLLKRSKVSAGDTVIDLDTGETVERPDPIRSVHPDQILTGRSGGSDTGMLRIFYFCFSFRIFYRPLM